MEPTSQPHTPPPVLVERHGRVGLLTLNRPQVLNALDLQSLRMLTAALREWADDPQVVGVVARGATVEGRPPALCAGGDLKFFYHAALAADPRLDEFFSEEYILDYLVHRYPKPYVALMDGMVMGGGMGISQGAALRVLTERSQLAMPETRIGLFPDVGGGWFLGRCPGRIGEYLALSGQSLRADDAIACGLGDCLVDSARLPRLCGDLLAAQRPEQLREIVQAGARDAGASPLLGQRAAIDRHFGQPDIGAVMASLAGDQGAFARATLHTLRQHSPLMLGVALELVRRARGMDLADELRLERGLMHHCFHRPDGVPGDALEGIRALIIDKDRQPRWQPARVEDVRAQAVQQFFASPWPVPGHPLAALGRPR